MKNQIPNARTPCSLSCAILAFIIVAAPIWPWGPSLSLASDTLADQVFNALPLRYALIAVDSGGGMAFENSVLDPQYCLLGASATSEVLALSDPHIQNELGLELSDSLWIADFAGRHRPVFRRVKEKAVDLIVAAEMQRLIGDRDFNFQHELGKPYKLYVRLRESVMDPLKAHFSSETWRRLVQLQIRQRFLNGGILTALVADRPVRDALGCDDATIRQLEEVLPGIRAHLDGQVAPLYARLTKDTLGVLTTRQRAALAPLVKNGHPLKVPAIEHLLWQCLYAQEPRRRYADEIEELMATSFFTIAPSGQLRTHRSLHRNTSTFYRAATTSSDVAMEEYQRRECARETVRILQPLYSYHNEVIEKWKTGEIDYDTLMDRLYENAMEMERKCYALYLDHLLPFQAREMKQLLQRHILSQRGLMPSLVSGRLGESLEITDDQRRRLRTVAGKYALEFQDRSVELESYVWQQIRKTLPPAQSARLVALVGKPPTKLPGAPTLLVLPLRFYRNAEGLRRLLAKIDAMKTRRGLDNQTPNKALRK